MYLLGLSIFNTLTTFITEVMLIELSIIDKVD